MSQKKADIESALPSSAVRLVIAWAWAGVPLLWGVTQTFSKALALFQ